VKKWSDFLGPYKWNNMGNWDHFTTQFMKLCAFKWTSARSPKSALARQEAAGLFSQTWKFVVPLNNKDWHGVARLG